ncbi:TPA: hypothetical protein DEP96_04135 [Candidatus Uhrbacteria bacterium]|nr:hypothetical protein [Candidatus Uhrbacteria bacterium]
MIVLFLSAAFASDQAPANTPTEEYDARPAFVYVPSPRPLDTTPLVLKVGCQTYVYDPAESYQMVPRLVASPAGGYTNPVSEALLMEQLRHWWSQLLWDANHPRFSYSGWKTGAIGNRLCAHKAESGDILCLEPRGDEFVEVYVGNTCGNSVSYTREEALTTVTVAFGLPANPSTRNTLGSHLKDDERTQFREEDEAEAFRPTAAPTSTVTLTPDPIPRRR